VGCERHLAAERNAFTGQTRSVRNLRI